jgi:hypothetical protein
MGAVENGLNPYWGIRKSLFYLTDDIGYSYKTGAHSEERSDVRIPLN